MQTRAETAETEIAHGQRFAFGKNWAAFLRRLDAERIQIAEESIVELMGMRDFSGKSFLDIGSGSGVFSLCARRLGATVTSFDCDPDSVACTRELKRRYYSGDTKWRIDQASILDSDYISDLGRFDVVYSWGALHHTGKMWLALDNAMSLVAPHGLLCLAIYNDQGAASRIWRRIKAAYCRLPSYLRWSLLIPAFLRLWGPSTVKDLVHLRPFTSWRDYRRRRGMSPWEDVVDWVGGFPFEVSKPEEIMHKCLPRGFQLIELSTCGGGHGCNQFVFKNTDLQQSRPLLTKSKIRKGSNSEGVI